MWTIHSYKEFDRFLSPRLNEERDVHFEDLRNEIAVAQSIWPGEAKKVVPWNWSKWILHGCVMLTHLTATVETWDTRMTISRFSSGCPLEAPTKLDGLKNCFPKSFWEMVRTLKKRIFPNHSQKGTFLWAVLIVVSGKNELFGWPFSVLNEEPGIATSGGPHQPILFLGRFCFCSILYLSVV